MYVLFLFLDAWTDTPVTSTFLIKHDWPATGKPALYMPPIDNDPLMASPAGDHQGPKHFQTTELPGEYPRPKHYSPRTGSLIT